MQVAGGAGGEPTGAGAWGAEVVIARHHANVDP